MRLPEPNLIHDASSRYGSVGSYCHGHPAIQAAVQLAVNRAMVQPDGQIGWLIVEHELHGQPAPPMGNTHYRRFHSN